MSCPIFLRTIIVFSGLEGLSFSCYRSSFLRPGTLEMNSFLASNENYCVCILCSLVPDCNPVDSSLPGSSVHGIFQARILVWVAISSSRGSSWPRDWNCVFSISCIGRQILYYWATWEAPDTAIQFTKSRREVQQALGHSKWLGGERESGNRWWKWRKEGINVLRPEVEEKRQAVTSSLKIAVPRKSELPPCF